MLAEEEIARGEELGVWGKGTVFQFDIYDLVKKFFLVIPTFFIIDLAQVNKFNRLHGKID
jgi:hypothetical protein